MRRRRVTPAVSLLGLAAAISTADAQAASAANERSIYSFPLEIRKRNYVRLSTQACDECQTIEEFYKANPLGFVLFYERALIGGHRYKEAIVKGWMETCNELRWSRIACGMVDMVSDRPIAERYIDPKTAPAHIVVSNGEPVIAQKHQVDPLLKKPGDKATMLAHVGDLLKDLGSMASLALSTQVNSKEALQQLLRRHHLVIVAFAGEQRRLADAFRAAVQEAVLHDRLSTHVEKTVLGSDEGRKGKGLKDKLRIAWVAAQGKGLNAQFGVPEGLPIAAFIGGVLQPGTVPIKPEAKIGDVEVLEAVKKVWSDSGKQLARSGQEERRGKGKSEL